MAMTREQIEEQCAAYAVGALDKESEELLFKELQEADDEFRKTFSESVGVSYLMNQAVVHHTPSPLVKRDLLKRIIKGPKHSFSFSQLIDRFAISLGFGSPRFGFVVALLLLVVVAEVGFYAYIMVEEINDRDTQIAFHESKFYEQHQLAALQTELDQQREILAVLQSPTIEIVFMAGQEISSESYGKIIWDPVRKIAILQVSKLPAVPSDKDYQLWFMDKAKKPVSAGVFTIAGDNENYFKVSEIPVPEKNEISAFAVTIEPKGGVPQPTGAMYLLGSPSL